MFRSIPAFLPGFDRMMFSDEVVGIARPSTFPPPQWSEYALIHRMVFRRLHVQMMILDPQQERDPRPSPISTNPSQGPSGTRDPIAYTIEWHNVRQSRADWFVRDAVKLLEQVRKRREKGAPAISVPWRPSRRDGRMRAIPYQGHVVRVGVRARFAPHRSSCERS
jgi:hypothetical protein